MASITGYTQTKADELLGAKANTADLGDAAARDVGTTAGTVMAGDDSRVTSLPSTYATKAEVAAASSPFENVDVQEVRDTVTGTTWWITRLNKTTFAGGALVPRVGLTAGAVNSSDTKPVLVYVANNDLVAVINAGIFAININELPLGNVIIDGEILKSSTRTQYTLGILGNGTLKAYAPDVTAAAMLADGAIHAVTGFAPLIVDGVVVDTAVWAATTSHYAERHPRQIIGQHRNGDYFVASCDGRITGEAGVTLAQSVSFLQSRFAPWFAYNLDGGGSTQTFIGKKRVNRTIEDRPVATVIEFTETVLGPDTTPPTAGTLSAVMASDSAALTVTGAADDRALHTTLYAFSSNNGTTYSAWQAAATYSATGLTPSTAYTFRHKVRDLVGNETEGTAITATTEAGAPATGLASDNFNRANGPLGVTSGPEALPWTGIKNIAIVSNAAKFSLNDGRAVVDVGIADQVVTARFGSTPASGIIVRSDSTATNYYVARFLSGTWYIVRYVAGIATTAASVASPAPAVGDTITLRAVTAASSVDFVLYHNGTQIKTYSDTLAQRVTGTCAGITGNQNAIMDDFSCQPAT